MKTSLRLTVMTCLTAAACLSATTLTGCRSDTSFASIRKDTNPELKGLGDTHNDVKRNRAMTFNQNWRMISDDLGHVFYTDHPSRLSGYPVLSTSGNPR